MINAFCKQLSTQESVAALTFVACPKSKAALSGGYMSITTCDSYENYFKLKLRIKPLARKNTIAFLLFLFVFHFFYIPLHLLGCFSAPRTDYSTLKNYYCLSKHIYLNSKKLRNENIGEIDRRRVGHEIC